MAAPPLRPRLRSSKPAPEVVKVFEEVCERELRTPGKAIEALMISYAGMTSETRDELAIERHDFLKASGSVKR